jgi:PAS domain S-box-containing protein
MSHDPQLQPARWLAGGGEVEEAFLNKDWSLLHNGDLLYREVLRGIPAAVYATDAEGRITFYNEAAAEFWQRSPTLDEDQWCDSCKFYTPDGRPLPLDECPMAVCLREGRAVRGHEIIIERPDGSRRNILPYPQPLRDSEGAIIGGLNMLVDVTDRRLAEQALRESEERFSRFMQHLPGLAWIKDAEGRYVFANAAAEKAFQKPLEELRGKKDDEIFPPHVAAQFRENDRRACDSDSGLQEVETLAHHDGRLHFSIVNKFPIPGSDGHPALIGGMAIDITERLQVEAALRESEQRFRLMADAAPVLIWVTDEHRQGVYFNQRWLTFTGRSLEQESGAGWLEPIHPDDRELVAETRRRAFDTPEPFRIQFRMRRADGAYRWLLDHGVPRFRSDGQLAGYIGTCIDVTDAKLAAQALRSSETRYRGLVEGQAELVCRFKPDGTILFANHAYARARGCSPESLVGANLWDFVDVEDRERVRRQIDGLRPDAPEVQIENRFETADGSRWLHWTNRALEFDDQGRPTEIQKTGIDITERKEVEETLRQDEMRFRTMANLTPAMIWTAAPDGEVSWSNDRWFEYTGIPRDTPHQWLQIVHPDDVATYVAAWTNSVETGAEFDVEVRMRRGDGEYRWFVARATPIRDPSGRIVEWYGSASDIHDRRQADQDRAFLASIVESTNDAVVSKTLDGVIRSWNAGAERLFGYSAEEVVGRSITLIIPPELLSEEYSILDRLRRGERIEHFETVRVAKDGRRLDISLTISPIRDGTGRIIGASKVARDVSLRKRAERQIRQSEQRFRHMANAAPVLIWISGVDKSFNWFNQPWLDFVGRSLEQEVGDGWIENIHPDDRQRCVETYHNAFDGREHFTMEYRLRRHDGVYRWVLGRGVPLLGEDNEFNGYIGSCIDISERRQAEAALQAKEIELDLVTNSTPLILARCSRDLRYLYVNRAAAAYFGCSPEELIGKRIEDQMGPEAFAIVKPRIEQVLRGEKVDYEAEIPYATLGRRWLHLSYVPNRDEHGEVVGWVASIVDITARKRAEDALRQSEDRFRMMADNIAQLAWICDELGDAIWYNKRWYEYTGTTYDEMRGWGWRTVHHPDHLDRVTERLRSCYDAGTPWEDTFPLRGADGEYRWFLSRAFPIRDDAGHIVHWFGTNTDITAQLQAEEALREADRRKDEFLAMLAHELRNPLAPIRTGLELLKLLTDDPVQLEETRSMMERQTRQLITLVDDLLDVSRITRSKLELRKCRILLSDAVASAVEASRPFIDEVGHTLEVRLPEHPLFVHADPNRLAQVISNLLNNAAKYTPEGGRIELSVEANCDDVEILVRDNGIGIPPEHLDKIFEMFAQIDRPQERGYTGLGIGLTLVKSLVTMHGGSIEAHSSGVNQGSTFRVRLPLLIEKPVAETSPTRSQRGPKATYRHRVLVVDDNRPAAELLSMVVKMLGNEVRMARDGVEAVEAAAEFLPDVVLMDIGMPRMNGYEAAQAIRQQPWGQEMMLVALTGWGQEEDKRKSKAAGFEYHIVKPAEPSDLHELFDHIARRRSPGTGRQEPRAGGNTAFPPSGDK